MLKNFLFRAHSDTLTNMKRAFILLGFVIVFLLAAGARSANAIDCSATFEQPTRALRGCIGGFATQSDLQNTIATFTCTGNSNAPDGSLCRSSGVTPVTFSLDFRNSDIHSNASGYWACTGVDGLARPMGKMEITFKDTAGTEICPKQTVSTIPTNWGTLPEDGAGSLAGFGDTSGGLGNICRNAGNNAACMACFNNKGAWTALGCIPTDPSAFIGKLLSFGVALAGGIAFLLILLGGFQILTSTGNPEQLQAGQELVSSAVSGLLLIIFSVFLLRLIGVDILGIPGFN